MKKIKLLSLLSISILLTGCGGVTSSSTSVISSPTSISEQVNGKIMLDAPKYSLIVGECLQLTCKAINIKNADIGFKSLNEDIATVNPNTGEVLTLKEGQVTLVAYDKLHEDISSTITLNVETGIPNESFTYYDFDMYKNRRHSLNANGNQNVLVIPVTIKGFEDRATSENLQRIKDAFVNDEACTYKSVKSFYNESSYGNLDMNFIVADEWYNPMVGPNELSGMKLLDDGGASKLVERAADWYKKKYKPSAESIDQNNDGFIDAVWVIYSAPTFTNHDYSLEYPNFDSSVFWAFTVDSYVNRGDEGNKGNPVSKIYAWASLDFLDDYGIEGSLDTHTLIHETGHMFGLADYYCTMGTKSGYATPLGCIDMMDNNVGDHNAYSKFALGWTKPRVIKEASTIELTPFEDNGDFILLTNEDFNGTAFDEYFTIEYITPTGLSEMDYASPYPGNSLQGYSEPGIRIMHIDSRPVNKYAKFESDPTKFINDPISNTDYPTYTAYYDKNNTKPMYQATLMQNNFFTGKYNVYSSGRKYYKALQDGTMDADDALFHEGDSFSLDETSPYNGLMPSRSNRLDKYAQSGDDLDTFNYEITIKKLTPEKATIEISII